MKQSQESSVQWWYLLWWLLDLAILSIILSYLYKNKPSKKWENAHKAATIYVGILILISLFNIGASYMGYRPHLTLGEKS